MNAIPSVLFEVLKEDYSVLGRGVHEISEHLRGGDLLATNPCTDWANREAGVHVGSQQQYSYPVVRLLLGDAEADQLTKSMARARQSSGS